ncbi:hypothetical protein [Streptomyces sp. NPDC003998]
MSAPILAIAAGAGVAQAAATSAPEHVVSFHQDDGWGWGHGGGWGHGWGWGHGGGWGWGR